MSEQMWGSLRVNDHERRAAVRSSDRAGLASVDVESNGREPVLRLTFLGHTPAGLVPENVRVFGPDAGRGIRAITVERRLGDDTTVGHLTVRLSHQGGPGTYRLRLVEARRDGRPGHRVLRGVDVSFGELAFSFNAQRPVDGPPEPVPVPSQAILEAPNTYLARDYGGLRSLLLDRLAVTQPLVREEHAADLTVTLLELFAYLGDDLAYYQDDAATEAYLTTARRRTSVRRHARLVGYRLHDGCQARAWLSVDVGDTVTVPLAHLRFSATSSPLEVGTLARAGGVQQAQATFTAVGIGADPSASTLTATWRPSHTDLSIWSYGEHDSVLCAGATRLTLVDGKPASRPTNEHVRVPPRPQRVLDLEVGDVLILEALQDASGIGPADLAARHPVRLTAVHRRYDALFRQGLVEVQWSSVDALPFDLPVSVTTTAGDVVRCAHACGNVILVGHGQPVTDDVSGPGPVLPRRHVTRSALFPDPADVARHQAHELRRLDDRVRSLLKTCEHFADHGQPLSSETIAGLGEIFGRLMDELPDGDSMEVAWQQAELLGDLFDRVDRVLEGRRLRAEQLAWRCESFGPLDRVLLAEVARDWGSRLAGLLDPDAPSCWGPAAEAFPTDPRAARPMVVLDPVPSPNDPGPETTWTAVPDLLRAEADARQLVAEVDDEDLTHLRLSPRAARPASGHFTARYWVGNGTLGNVGAEAINTVTSDAIVDAVRVIKKVRNPLAASGGTDPEDIDEAKRAVPGSFSAHQPRALVAADYAAQAQLIAGVSRAAADLQVTGSHQLVSICVQPKGMADPPAWFLREVHRDLFRIRRLGDEIRVLAPRYRPLYVKLKVLAAATADTEEVAKRVGLLLSSGWLDPRTPGLFNPTRLQFGRTLWASWIVAAVQSLAGVTDVELLAWGFLPTPPRTAAAPPDRLCLSGLEMPRLDNDPVHPERGYVAVSVRRAP